MDPTTAVRTDTIPAVATVLAPGAFASAPYTWLALSRWPQIQVFLAAHEAIAVATAIVVWVVAGFFIDSVGSYVEVYGIDRRRANAAGALEAWWQYLRIVWADSEPIGQRYLRRLLVTFKFELNMCVAVVAAGPGIWLLQSTGHMSGTASTITGVVLAVTAVLLFTFAWGSANVLAKVRETLIEGTWTPGNVSATKLEHRAAGSRTEGPMPNDTAATPRERLDGLLALHAQSRHRFSELESLEWRVNFAIWAFLAGIAYLFRPANGAGAAPPHSAIAMFMVAVVVIHCVSLIKLGRSAFHHRLWADYYRDNVKQLVGLPNEHLPPPGWNAPVPGHFLVWILIEVGATVLLAGGVSILVW